MESLLRLQLDVKNIIEKGKTNFKKSPKERITLGYLSTRLEALEVQWVKFTETHTKIIEKATIDDLKGPYFTSNIYDQTEEIYITYKSELKDTQLLVQPVAKESREQVTSINNNRGCNIKLPKINIPSFSGKYEEWTSFRDLFTSLVHLNKTLDDVQKLHYLKGCLTGEAEQLIRQVPVTAANYPVCWEQLEHRYNNKRHLANCILQRLFGQKGMSSESAATLRHLLDTTNDCLSALTNLGINVTTWDIIIIHIISTKLDQETRKQWELKIAMEETNDLPTIGQFKTFLESRFRALEFIEPQKATGQWRSRSRTEGSGQKVMLVTNNKNSTPSGQAKIGCENCGEGHKLCFCEPFIKMDVSQRRQLVQSKRICFNCLGGNHLVNQCKRSTSCHICNKKHHTLLHIDSNCSNTNQSSLNKQGSGSADISTSADPTPVVSCVSTKELSINHVLLATALVQVQTASRNYQIIRALLDQGSQASFITEAAVQFLRLKRDPVRGIVSGLGSSKTITTNHMVTLVLRSVTDPKFELEIGAYVLKNITTYLPEKQLAPIMWSELQHITLADPQYSEPNKIDILLGADIYCKIIQQGLMRAPTGSVVAQCTRLGWILSGTTQAAKKSNILAKPTSLHVHVEQNDLLKQFWEIEDQLPHPKGLFTEQEQRCEELFTSTTTRSADGRYIVRLPFKESKPDCVGGDIREIAMRRFTALERKFTRNPDLQREYTRVIEEYIQLSHMRRVQNPDSKLNEAVYLPHHAVIREDKITTKVRVVFDASSKNNKGVSLNDTLMIGPTLQSDLRHIVLRWRLHRIALTADIVKMYRQVRVAEEDVAYQRILWRNNPNDEVQDYELLTVTFGTASAPYLAVKVLHQVALDHHKEFPKAAERVPTSFYMDDLMTGCSSVEEGKELYLEMKELLIKAGFQLQKWNSNNKELSREIESYESKEEKELIVDHTKILGLTWCRSTDEFKYTVQLPPRPERVTKRNIISDIARLFDPLGWIAPSIIVAKILIQKLWLLGIGWDDEVPNEIKNEWDTYRNDLTQLHKVRVPRWLGTVNRSLVELHGFSDASKAAYAAVIYTRYVDSAGQIHVALLVAKTKIAPIKTISIPRLELCAALLLTRLLADVAQAMSIERDKVHAWTDSTVVLAWLNSHPSRWKTFVGNRVSEILTTLEADQWSHVSSKDNPADHASRGVLPTLLFEKALWFSGPQFLYNAKIEYNRPINLDVHLEENIKSHIVVSEEDSPWIKYSSLHKLLRVTALCRIFIRIKLKNRNDISKSLSKSELNEALKCCIRRCQRTEFKNEYAQLKQNKPLTDKTSKLKTLCPFLDQEDIIRVGGRLQQAFLSDQQKHPIILPHNAHLTRLLVADSHERTLHGGPQIMINFIRSAYWVIRLKSIVKTHVRRCVTCVKTKAETYNQLMGSLPSARCTPTRAFLHSGVDYAGPVQIRTSKGRGHRSYKGYICVFVCMATRAIHLEVVSDMSTQGFIAAFRRFVARRGHCAQIWSDNGTNFVGAARELKELVAVQQECAEHLETHGTTWHFIPPHAPNFGGLWEAAVKSTKFHLKRVIGNSTLTYEEMSTLLSQIEACLNSRPMTVINGEDINEPLPLTPGHFLIGESLINVPSPNYTNSNVSSLSRWQHIQKMLQTFWQRWSMEYLSNLVHRYKWSFQTPEPKIGDIVLVKEPDLPPACWLLGRIVEKHPGLDDFTRVVTLRTKKGLLKRPTSRLCVLPINE